MSHLPQVTVRTRLTLLYTSLFAICGAIVVAVSYSLVARLEPAGQGRQAPANFLKLCRSEHLSAHPDPRVLAKCDDARLVLLGHHLEALAEECQGVLPPGGADAVGQVDDEDGGETIDREHELEAGER